MKSRTTILFALALIIFNFIVYFPSLGHIQRADQVIFNMETDEIDNFPALMNYMYSYARTRQLNQGDEILFRPVFLATYAIEKTIFGYNFFYWQLTGIILHLLVMWQLFRVLNFLRPHIINYFIVFGISVCHLTQEMVIWHHIHGYLFFLIFILQVFYHFINYLKNDRLMQRELWLAALFLLLANFTFELGVIINILLVCILIVYKKQVTLKRLCEECGILLIPAAWYLSFNLTDYFSHLATNNVINPSQSAASFQWLSLAITLVYFFLGPIIPAFFKIDVGDRSSFDLSFAGVRERFLEGGLDLYINLLGVFLIVLFLMRNLWDKPRINIGQEYKGGNIKTLMSWIALFCSLMIILLLFVGRVTARGGVGYLKVSTYYIYFFNIFFVIFLQGLLIAMFEYFKKPVTIVPILGLFLMITGVNAHLNYSYNQALKEKFYSSRIFFQELEEFIARHKEERDFSYSFVFKKPRVFRTFWIGRTFMSKESVVEEAEMLHRKYINYDKPKYYLIYTEPQGMHYFTDKKDAERFLL